MKISDTPDTSRHVSHLLLAYLEGHVNAEERTAVSEHIASCPECEEELRLLDHTVRSISGTPEVFCPDSWELFQFVEKGDDPSGAIALHLAACASCRYEFASYTHSAGARPMPEALRSEVRKRFGEARAPSAVYPGAEGFLPRFVSHVKQFWRIPILATVAATAVALVVVLMSLQGSPEPFVGLSSIAWDSQKSTLAPKSGLRLMGPSLQDKRVAVLMIFTGFKHRLPQDRIDSLYGSIEPTQSTGSRFDIVSPEKVKASLENLGTGTFDRQAVLEKVSANLHVPRILILEITKKENLFEIQGELVDVKTGEIINTTREKPVDEPGLPFSIRNCTQKALAG